MHNLCKGELADTVYSLLQATLLDSKQGTYEKFLKTLLDAKRQRWKPSKVGTPVVQLICT